MHKVLLDVSPAQQGYRGIPQDARLLFKVLSQQSSIQLDGLVLYNGELNFGVQPTSEKDGEQANLLRQVLFLDRYLGSPLHYSDRPFVRSLQKFRDAFRRWENSPYRTQKIDTGLFENYVWRNFFEKTLEPADRTLLTGKSFLYSDLSQREIRLRAYFKKPRPTLLTNGFDFAVFHEPHPVNLSPGTKKIFRFHDLIPAFYPHYFTPWSAAAHSKLLLNAQDASYVCNSAFSAKQLLAIAPGLQTRTTVIPCTLPEGHKPTLMPAYVPTILATRMVPDHFKDGPPPTRLQDELLRSKTPPEYILAVSTVEPRKNYVTLVRAWEQYRAKTGSDIKLVIVGSPGWLYQDSMDAIKPHVQQGSIYHLEKLPIEDLRVLYTSAKVLLSLSHVEGFDFTPLEAMQCDCPTLISDIPVHKEIMGEASLYCDPYSSESVCEGLMYLLDESRYPVVSEELRQSGREQVKRYTAARTGEMWIQALDNIKAGKGLSP